MAAHINSTKASGKRPLDKSFEFAPTCSLAFPGDDKETSALFTAKDAEFWTSAPAAKFASGRYLSTCRLLGFISLDSPLVSFIKRKRRKRNAAPPKQAQGKPPTVPIPTLAQAKKHVLQTTTKDFNEEELQDQARQVQQYWKRIQKQGPFKPAWAKRSGELIPFMEDNTPSLEELLELEMTSTETKAVLQALCDLQTPHAKLYDQPLIVTRIRLVDEKIQIAVYANRLLFECMTQQLQVILTALDPSSYHVDRPLQVAPSQNLAMDAFASAPLPKVILPSDQDIIEPHEEEEHVEGSTRYDNNTLDAFSIPGLMKSVENKGTMDETLWKETIAPKLQGLKMDLLLHQQHGVCWMHQMERIGNLNHLVWEKRKFCEGDSYYYSPSLGQLRLTLSNDAAKENCWGGGGVLCDEMGLGKTLQTVALVVATLEDTKNHMRAQSDASANDKSLFRHATLIIVPPALLTQWIAEIEKIASWLVVDTLLLGSSELERVQPNGDGHETADIVLTTYQALEDNVTRRKRMGVISLSDQIWGRIVLDEMQEIRSWTTRISKLINRLESDCRWMLSGTPFLEDITDLNGELCFLGLEPFSASNDDGFFHFAVASHWQHKSTYGLNVLEKLAKLVMLRRSKSMTIEATGHPLLGLKPFTLIYEPVPQEDSEHALYCFLEFLMHSVVSKPEPVSNGEADGNLEARKFQEQQQQKNKVAFLRMLRHLCLSPALLNGGLGCQSQLITLNRWLREYNRRSEARAIRPIEESTSASSSPSASVPADDSEEVLSCDEAVRFLSQVEDLARTDRDFVTDVRLGGGGGISNRNRALINLDERYEEESQEFERCNMLCLSARRSRAKAYWHLALEAVTTGKLFAVDNEAYNRVNSRFQKLWRWRSCFPTLAVFRGWQPSQRFFGRSVVDGRDEAMLSLFSKHPKFTWAHPFAVLISHIPSAITMQEITASVSSCLQESGTTFQAVEYEGRHGYWKAIVVLKSKEQCVTFMRKAKSLEGIALKSLANPEWIRGRIRKAKSVLDECMAAARVHPCSLTMKALAKAKKEYKMTELGLRIFSLEQGKQDHVQCQKAFGDLRPCSTSASGVVFDSLKNEIEESNSVLLVHNPLLSQRKRTMENIKKKIGSGVPDSIGQLTSVQALQEGKTNELICPICCDSLGQDGRLIALTRCGHMSCKECLMHWIRQKSGPRKNATSCLECRKPVYASQLVTVDPRKTGDQERDAKLQDEAKSALQEAAAVLENNDGRLPPNLWEALYLAKDLPPGADQSAHDVLTSIPRRVLGHLRHTTSMRVQSGRQEPKGDEPYKLSSRIRALLSDLPNDDVSVVFASSKVAVQHLLLVLNKKGIGCRGLFTGQTEQDSKVAVSDWHSNDDVLVLVVQAGVAACGLTLTKASKMFLVEPFLKHEEEKQAYARLHRYGQEREVVCKVYYTKVSVEERLLKWRHRNNGENQNFLVDGEATTIFAPLRGVDMEDDEKKDSKQTEYLLGLNFAGMVA